MKRLIAYLFLLVNISFSQSSIEWVSRCSDAASNFFANDAAIDNNGFIYITFTDFVYSNKLVKLNSAGNILWIKTYPFVSTNVIKLDNNGSIYLGGTKENLYEDFWVIKYDPEGNIVWENSYGPNEYHTGMCRDLIVDNSGNVYATGLITNSGNQDYCTIKYNADGTRAWVNSFHYGINYTDAAKSITLDNNNNVLVTGEVFDSSSALLYCTIKYNNTGELAWYKTTAANLYEPNKIMFRYPDIFVTGRAIYGIGTVSYASNGNLRWMQVVPGRNNDMLIDNTGNLVITGQLYDTVLQRTSLLILKYNNSGSLLWTEDFISGGYSSGKSVIYDENDNLYVLGSGNFGYDNHLLTLKYSNSGDLLWQEQYSVESDSFYTPLKILYSNNSVYSISNVFRQDSLRYETIVIKYTQTIGIEPVSAEIPQQFSLSQNYPNPFNPSTKIRFAISGSSAAQTFLSVYDMLGREISTLVNQELKPGTYEVDWNASSFPSGVYFYRLNAGSFTETKKMLLVK